MLTLLLGVCAGAVMFLLLVRFTGAATSGRVDGKLLLYGFLQLLIPILFLVLVAFWRRDELLYAGIGMTGVLIAGGVFRFISARRKGE